MQDVEVIVLRAQLQFLRERPVYRYPDAVVRAQPGVAVVFVYQVEVFELAVIAAELEVVFPGMAYQQLFRVLSFLAGQDVVKKQGYLRARRLIVAQDAERLIAVGVVRRFARDDGDADAVIGIHVLRAGHDRLCYVERL